MRAPFRSPIRRALAASGALALTALLAACSSVSASGASVQATATCPPTPSFTAVSGSVTAVNASSVTVQPASSASVTIALDNTTRYSLTTSVPISSLTAGTPVLVLTDTNATTARSVRVLPAGTAGGDGGGFGGGSGGFGGGPRGTPRPGANPACARRGGFGGGGGGAGTNGTGSAFQGLRGTVDSATATTLTFDDAQGQTYSVAITATTTITKTAAAQASDLKAGAKVIIAAQKTNGQTLARTITIQA